MAGYLRTLARAIFARKASLTPETMRALMQGHEVGDRVGRSYASLAKGGFEQNVCVYRALTEIARGGASVPLDVYVNGEKQKDHPLAKLLRKPNPRQSRPVFMEEALSYFQLDGNQFFYAIDAEPGGEPLALQNLRPDRVEVKNEGAALVFVYIPNADGTGTRTWKVFPDDVTPAILQVKTFNPMDKSRGLSPLIPGRSAIDRHNLADEWNAQSIRNGAVPPGVFLVDRGKEGDASLTDPEREALKVMLDEIASGPKNARRPIVLEGGLKYQSTGWSPVEMDWSGGKAAAARDAVNALGFPPMLLGIPGDNTFSNQREARLALWENTILPLLGSVVEEIAQWLGPRYSGQIEIRPNLDQVPALALRRERVWDRVKGSDWLTINEMRAETGLDERPEPEADQILTSFSRIPLGAVSVSQQPVDVEPDPEGL